MIASMPVNQLLETMTEHRWYCPTCRMAERAGATVTEVAGSHVSMVSHPQATIDAILAAASAVQSG